MTTHIALFRGINVGGNNVLPMKALVKLLEQMGLAAVQTYIQSGNVVFQSDENDLPTLAASISSQVQRQFGFAPKVLLLSAQQLLQAIDNKPFPDSEGKALHFYFLDRPADHPDRERLEQLKSDSEQYQLTGQVLYLYAPEGIGRSKLAAAVEQCLGVAVTARNWNTVAKLQQLCEANGSSS